MFFRRNLRNSGIGSGNSDYGPPSEGCSSGGIHNQALMFLTEKRDGEVKARTCANGSTQCQHIAKDEATSPRVTTEAIFIQSTIFAHEQRDVATCNIPGAFLHADNPDMSSCVWMGFWQN